MREGLATWMALPTVTEYSTHVWAVHFLQDRCFELLPAKQLLASVLLAIGDKNEGPAFIIMQTFPHPLFPVQLLIIALCCAWYPSAQCSSF